MECNRGVLIWYRSEWKKPEKSIEEAFAGEKKKQKSVDEKPSS
jgi:hypothetical protein